MRSLIYCFLIDWIYLRQDRLIHIDAMHQDPLVTQSIRNRGCELELLCVLNDCNFLWILCPSLWKPMLIDIRHK